MPITAVEDLDALTAFTAVRAASFAADFTALPADPIDEAVPLLDGKPRAGELTRMFLATSDGVAVGALTLGFPLLDNLTTASLEVLVHPDHRRRGHGQALLDFGLDQVRAEGRSRVFFEAPALPDGSDGPAFPMLRAAGAVPVLDDFRRLLDLTTCPPSAPVAAPEGYRVTQWTQAAPDDLVDGCAYLTGRMCIDSPMGDMDYEQEKWDAVRYREKEAETAERGRLRIATAVVHESGAVAGISEIGLNKARPDVAYQWTTIVDPDHRGHGLGLVLKSWNHQLLVRTEPAVRWLNTWNAASNTFMISVNETLGFEVAERWTEWQLDLVSSG